MKKIITIFVFVLTHALAVHAKINLIPPPSNITGGTSVCVGSTIQLSDASLAGGTWTSSNKSIVTVTSAGLVKGVAGGTVTITHSATGYSSTINITVYALPSVAAISGTNWVCKNSSVLLTDATPGGVWSSSNTSKATVDLSGSVLGIGSSNSVTINYTITDGTTGCLNVAKLTNFTVYDLPTYTSIKGANTICANASTTLTNGTSGGVWSSSNSAAATVNASTGLVSGVAGGNTTISYSYSDAHCSNSATLGVTINPLPDATISGNNNVCKGNATNLTAATAGGVWSSSNTSVATINSSGVVTGLTAGVTTISYAATNGCGTSTHTFNFTINDLPVIVSQSTAAATYCQNDAATALSITATGTGLSYQWYSNTVNSNTGGTLISGATTSNYTPSTSSAGTSYYYCVVSNSTNCTINSGVSGLITVNELPIITIYGKTILFQGDSIILTANPINGSWSSFNNSIASVNVNGITTGNTEGVTSVMYTYKDLFTGCTNSNSLILTVNARFLNYISDINANSSSTPCGATSDYLKLMATSNSSIPNNILGVINCGAFDLYYDDLITPSTPPSGFADQTIVPGSGGMTIGQVRINTLCTVLTQLQNTFDFSKIPSSTPIRINVLNSNTLTNPASTGYAAAAGPYFDFNGGINGGRVHDYIVTGIDPSPTLYHGHLIVNFALNFNNSVNDLTPNNCELDLYSTLLHEMGHCLGWLSNVSFSGTYPNLQPYINPNLGISLIDNAVKLSTSNIPGTTIKNPIFPINSTNFASLILSGNNVNSYTPNNYYLSGLDNKAANTIPVYSGTYAGNSWFQLGIGSPVLTGSFISHIDDQVGSYTYKGRFCPGNRKEYVMGPFISNGIMRRNYTKDEIEVFTNTLGYNLNTNNPNPLFSNIILSNTPPYCSKMGSNTFGTIYGNDLSTRSNKISAWMFEIGEKIPADAQLVNDFGAYLDFDISKDATIIDADGDPISINVNSIINFRGCGNGGNNHNQLTLINNHTIRYTPRANFYGRAQFGFTLNDSKEDGSFVIYTIDVTKGTNVTVPLNGNLVLNSDFEEGTEVKVLGNQEIIPNSTVEAILYENKLGAIYSDCHPYSLTSNPWFFQGCGLAVNNSWVNCGNASQTTNTFGDFSTSFPAVSQFTPIKTHPPSITTTGSSNNLRYQIISFQTNNSFYYLADDLQKCKYYKLEFDARSSDNINGSLPITLGFTNDATVNFSNVVWPMNLNNSALLYSVNTQLTGVGNQQWNHYTITFQYCNSTPSNIFYLHLGTNPYEFFIDNLSIKNITSSFSININQTNCNNLNANIISGVDYPCPYSYNWTSSVTGSTSLGASSSISIMPQTNNQVTYTVTVSDGCNIIQQNIAITTPSITITGSPSTIVQGNTLPIVGSISGGLWSVDDPTIATVTLIGGVETVTALSPGTVNIYYTINGCQATYTLTVLTACNVCSVSISNADFVSNINPTYTQNTYCMDADYNIPTGSAVTIQYANVRINSGVTINISDGAVLNILGSHLYGCDNMWDGIVVAPGGVLNINGFSYNGSTISSFIEDAITAVKMNDYRNVTFNNHLYGPFDNYLKVENTIFNRNYTAIQIDGYSDLNDQTNQDNNLFYPFRLQENLITCRDIPFIASSFTWPSVSTVENATNVITGNSPTRLEISLASPFIDDNIYKEDNNNAFLKPPYAGQKPPYGILLSNIGYYDNNDPINGNYYGITIGGSVLLTNRYNVNTIYNLFDNVDQGIHAINTNLKVTNCIFQKPYLKLGQPSYGVYAENTSNALNNPIPWDGYYKLDVSRLEYNLYGINYWEYAPIFFDQSTAVYSKNYFKNSILNVDIRSGNHDSYSYTVYDPISHHPIKTYTTQRGVYGIDLETDRYDKWGAIDNSIYNVIYPISIQLEQGKATVGNSQIPYTTENIEIFGNNIDIKTPLYTGTINYLTNYISDAISINALSNNVSNNPDVYIRCIYNNIKNVWRGIAFNGLGNKSVWADMNTINLKQDPNNTLQYGISLVSGSAFTNSTYHNFITDNHIFGDNITTNQTGIYVSQNQGANLRCNDVHNLNKGIYFFGGCPGSNCLSNTFTNDNQYGLYMDNNAIIGPQGTNDVINNYYIPADNDWGNSTWNGYEIATANGTDPILSTFYIRSANNYQPSSNSLIGYGGSLSYGIGYGLSVVYSSCIAEKVWCGGNDCYGNWRLAGINHFSNFKAKTVLTDSIRKLIATAEIIATAGMNIASMDSAEIMATMQQQLYNSLLIDTVLLNNSIILQNFMQQAPSAGSHWYNALVGDLLSKGDAQSAEFVLGMWEPDNKADSNYYLYYSWIAGLNLGISLSSQDTAAIHTMALSCSLTNGVVVYWARNLYNRITNQHIIFDNNCSNNVPEKKKLPTKNTIENVLQKEIKVFPNPTSGMINIQLPGSGNWQITITDMEGRIVWQNECRGCNGTIKHNLSGSKSVYFIKIINKLSGQQSINKIILQ